MRQSQMPVVCPEGVGRNIGNDHLLSSMNGGATRSRASADLQALDSLTVFFRERRRGTVPQSSAIGIQQQNGAQQSPVMLLNVPAQGVQNFRKGGVGHDHGQNLF